MRDEVCEHAKTKKIHVLSHLEVFGATFNPWEESNDPHHQLCRDSQRLKPLNTLPSIFRQLLSLNDIGGGRQM